jgi:ribosome-binding factor A
MAARTNFRPERLGDQVRDTLASLLLLEASDPGLREVVITGVKLSGDLQHAKIYYTLQSEGDRKATQRALDRANSFLRQRLVTRLDLRRAPQLEFSFDTDLERGRRVEALLRAAQTNPPSGTVPPSEAKGS